MSEPDAADGCAKFFVYTWVIFVVTLASIFLIGSNIGEAKCGMLADSIGGEQYNTQRSISDFWHWNRLDDCQIKVGDVVYNGSQIHLLSEIRGTPPPAIQPISR